MVISFSKLPQSFRNHYFASTPFKNFEIAYQRPIKAPPPIMAMMEKIPAGDIKTGAVRVVTEERLQQTWQERARGIE
jgi:hypothetical protein